MECDSAIVGLQRPQRDVPWAPGLVRSTEDGKTMEAMAQKSGDASDQMTSLHCFNSKDMIKPDQRDMEPGTFLNLNELFCVRNDEHWS